MGDEQRREHGTDGVRACQQCHRDTVEAHARQAGGVQRVPLGHVGQIEQACAEACQRTGNGHGEDDVLLLVDTGIAGGVLVQANGLELVAEGGLVQHHPDQHGHRCRQEDGNGGAVGLEQLVQAEVRDQGLGKIGVLTQVQSTGVAHVVHGAGAVLVDELIHQIQADPVEHNGGNDLVDVEVGLEETGDRAPQAAQQGCYQQADEPGQLEHDGAVQRTVSAQRVLTGCTDVEQAGLEGKRHGQSRS